MPSSPQRIAILGATGSIGQNTLDVIARHPARYRVVALAAQRQIDLLEAQIRQFSPEFAVVADPDAAATLRDRLTQAGLKTQVLGGSEALCDIAAHPEVDTVMAAIVGAAGLPSAMAAAAAGKRLLLANKEALVMAGPLFMDAVRRSGALLLPIDSEHNAIFQSLPASYHAQPDPDRHGVAHIILTASGGPFRGYDRARLESVTPAQAISHPQWVMGRKISVDSATLMNKGLEVIEAHYLFGIAPERIRVVVHPQSTIHSLVQYVDGSVLAELGAPDMRTPIAHALAWPERIASGVAALDLLAGGEAGRFDFAAPDLDAFPCLRLAFTALERGGRAPTILNAANEVAVAAFLDGVIGFLQIPRLIEATLNAVENAPVATLADVYAADKAARVVAESCLRKMETLA